MKIIIRKLSALKHPASFIQVNTIKGFKYIDKAGEIVNRYVVDEIPPQFSMGLHGLIIEKPKEKIEELKVSPQVIWMKFQEPDSLDMIADIYSKESLEILKILGVDKVSRIGWRNYFIYEFKNEQEQKKYLSSLHKISNQKLSLLRLEVETNSYFAANLIIQPVVKNDENKTRGVLFNIDVFFREEMEISKISNMLKDFRNYLKEGFLITLNHTFDHD